MISMGVSQHGSCQVPTNAEQREWHSECSDPYMTIIDILEQPQPTLIPMGPTTDPVIVPELDPPAMPDNPDSIEAPTPEPTRQTTTPFLERAGDSSLRYMWGATARYQ
jgi:hypothetical protein